MYQLVRIAQLIGLNAIPGFGFIELKWTGGTILALYWIENLIGSVFVAMRIALHRRLTHKRGHYVSHKATTVFITTGGRKRKISTLFGYFMGVAFPFTIAEGLFLAMMIANLPESEKIDFDSLRFGVRLVAALLAGGFLLDLIGIKDRPYFWIYRVAKGMVSRVIVLFFVVYVGVFALVFFNAPRAGLLVFVVLKTCIDIASEIPESWLAKYAPNRDSGSYSPEDEKQMEPA